MANLPISQLARTEEIPSASLLLVEMGDGSGTKTATKETLTREMGESLKVGNLEELKTGNKENLVEAINEAAKSGGGGASVDILDTPEEIEANTETGKSAGALALKEIAGSLSENSQFPDGTGFYPDIQNGVRGYNTDAARGADTFTPFSNGAATGDIVISYSHQALVLGGQMGDGGTCTGSGTITISLKDGEVIKVTNSGGQNSAVATGGWGDAHTTFSVSGITINKTTFVK